VVSQADKRGKNLEEDGGVFLVDLLPGEVGDPVRTRGRSGCALGGSCCYLFLRERWHLLIRPSSGGGGDNGSFGGKKWFNRTSFICWGVSDPGRDGKQGGAPP